MFQFAFLCFAVVTQLTEVAQATDPAPMHESFVGFSASKQIPQTVYAGEIVTFNVVSLNIGDLYRPTLSRFQCENGVYFVSVTIQKNGNDDLYVSVLVANSSIMDIHDVDNPNNIITNNAIVYCGSGDFIWVEATGNGSVFGEPGVPRSTFNVFQISDQNDFIEYHERAEGFTAYADTPQTISNTDIIQFQTTLSNFEDDYNSQLSRYMCPHTGDYLVTVTLCRNGADEVYAGVQKSSVIILHVEDEGANNTANCISNSRIFECNEGEIVSVQATGEGGVYGSTFEPHTTFSIWYLETNDKKLRHEDQIIGCTTSKNDFQIYEAGDTITFDVVLFNSGNGYNALLNRFECNVNGYYYVMVNYQKLDTEPLSLDVTKNSVTFLRSVEEETATPWNTVSNSALISCSVGDVIQVKASDTGAVNGDPVKALTTFSVLFIYEEKDITTF